MHVSTPLPELPVSRSSITCTLTRTVRELSLSEFSSKLSCTRLPVFHQSLMLMMASSQLSLLGRAAAGGWVGMAWELVQLSAM